jgi:hypothetical protein
MEMLERCPGCSQAREFEPSKAESSARKARPCSRCGYDGPFPSPKAELAPPRDSMPSFSGARAKLATATQDLFRLSGNYAIPVDAKAVSEPPAPSVPEPISSSRKPEASMMFSLEALMKATQPSPKQDLDEAPSQLWNMHAEEPLFGTSHDQALLTTPFKMEPAQSMDSMTLPSQAPNGRRWWPIVLAATAGLAFAGAGLWVFGLSNGAGTIIATTPSSEPAALVPQPLPEPAGPAPLAPAAELGQSSLKEASLKEPSVDEPSKNEAGGAATVSDPETSPTPANTDAVSSTKTDSDKADSDKAEAGKDKAAKDKAGKKPAVRVDKPSAPPPKLVDTLIAFDKNAAKSALSAASEAASSCGAGGAAGKGKIQVTFAPSGKVSDAQLVEGPFEGTTAGKCALRQFKAAKVPAFSGAPITVAKSFKID